jgi:hypothetical protein
METKSSPASPESFNSEKVSLLLTSCAIGILMVLLVYDKNYIFGSDAGNWSYSYFNSITSLPLWIPILVLSFLGMLIFIGKKLIFIHEKITLWGSFLIAIFIQLLIHHVYPIQLGKMVVSDNANAFYSAAVRYSPIEILAHYNDSTLSLTSHASWNMPGKILLFQLFKLFTSSPQVMGYLVIIISTLGGVLLYRICEKLFHDKQAAFYAFILYMLIPGKLFFFPILNTITPLFILLCLYLFLIYIERKNILFLGLLGAVFYPLILFEPSPLVTGLIFVGILLKTIGERKVFKKDLWAILLYTFLGFLCVYAIFYIFFSFDLLSTFLRILNEATNFNLITHRTYKLWVLEDFKEFFYSVGTPIMIIFICMVSKMVLQWKTLKYKVLTWSMENLYILSLLATFGIVLFSGINRGEISRLWIYLAVFFQVPAALFIAKIPKNAFLFFAVAGTVAFQSIIALQRINFISP